MGEFLGGFILALFFVFIGYKIYSKKSGATITRGGGGAGGGGRGDNERLNRK